MILGDIKALTFDTGGTVLDWHSGFSKAFAAAGRRHQITRDWPALANELRRRCMIAMLNLGKDGPPAYNFDGAHRFTLDALLDEEGLSAFDETDRHAIAWDAPHSFSCWPDVPAALARMRKRHTCISFTILSYRIIIDTSRYNGLNWDGVLSCEGFGVYKLLPQAYLKAAGFLQLEPEQCCMVACHPFDLDAARAVGFRTAFVRRLQEWGKDNPAGRHAVKKGDYDVVVDDFSELADVIDAVQA